MVLQDVNIRKNITRIWFEEESKPYKIRAFSDNFLICTKPYNPQKTVLYSIVDLRRNIRGPEGVVFEIGAEDDEDCLEMLERLDSGETEVSYRNNIELKIKEVRNIGR